MQGVRRVVLMLLIGMGLLGGCEQKAEVTATAPAPPLAPAAVGEPDRNSPQPKHAQPPIAAPVHERPGRDRPANEPTVIEGPALGSSVIRVPSTMKQGRQVIAQLIVSPTDLATLLRQDAVTRGESDVRDTRSGVRLVPRMRASLLAPGFDFDPKDVQEQAVKTGEPTVWTWTLVPADAGRHTLVFVLEGVVVVDGHETTIRPPALQVPVDVEVDPMRFVEKYWQWLMSVIVIPLVVFFFRRRSERRPDPPAGG